MLRVATRDRTGEFTAVAERVRKTIAVTNGGATDGGATASTSAVRERSENGNASDFAKVRMDIVIVLVFARKVFARAYERSRVILILIRCA
jgi:hypothetical protein